MYVVIFENTMHLPAAVVVVGCPERLKIIITSDAAANPVRGKTLHQPSA
jgi:hypothetical protein